MSNTFSSRPLLDDSRFRQDSGSTLSLSGTTKISGLQLYGGGSYIPFDVSGAVEGYALIYSGTSIIFSDISGSSGTTWGGITGTLSAQTDLQNALDAKADIITITAITTTYTASTSVNYITSSGSTCVFMNPSPSCGDLVTVVDIEGCAGTNNIEINGNGNCINGDSIAMVSTDRGSATFLYDNSSWIVTAFVN